LAAEILIERGADIYGLLKIIPQLPPVQNGRKLAELIRAVDPPRDDIMDIERLIG
jgi:hypothetical protein